MEVFLREVNAELERREEEEDEEPEQEETSDACPEGVRHLAEDLKPLMAGKHVLIIGGTPRVHTPPRLQKALGCASVSWPEVTKTDTPDRFESDLRHADVILVVKNFARHAAGGAATEVADETGAHRVVLTASYGVSKIISQLHDYFSLRGMLNGAAKDSG